MSTPNETRFGPNITRVLDAKDRNYWGVTFECGTPVLDSELNFIWQTQNEAYAQYLRSKYPSGILDFREAGYEQIFVPTLDSTYTGLEPNELLLQNFVALVNGWTVPVKGSAVNGGQYPDTDWLAIELPPSPTSLSKVNFLFLEVWLANIAPNDDTNKPSQTTVWRYGNTQYSGTNLPDQIIDPQGNIETTRRIQLQYKIRIVETIDFNTYPNGLEDPSIRAQGPNSTDTSYGYLWAGDTSWKDPGLWVAGDGSDTAAETLGTADGYIYSIPLIAVSRRNSSAWDIATNPNGSSVSVSLYPNTISDRPDGLYYDEVSKRDLMDVRKQVANTDYHSILEENFNSLVYGKHQEQFSTDMTGIVYGNTLMEADGISGPSVTQPGIYHFASADNSRRFFSDKGKIENRTACLDMSDATAHGGITDDSACPSSGSGYLSSVTIQYNANVVTGPQVTINLNPLLSPEGSVIANAVPTLTWRESGLPVNLVTGLTGATDNWFGLGDTTSYAFLDATDPTFVASGTAGIIDILYSIDVARGGGFRYVPEAMYLIEKADESKYMGFVETNDSSRIVPKFERPNLQSLPVIGGYADSVVDYNYEDFTTTKTGYTRLYIGHFQGNGTASYNTKTDFPSGVFNADGNAVQLVPPVGQTALGFIKFEKLTPSGFITIPTESVERGVDGNFIITFTQVFSTADVVRYSLALENYHCIYEKVTKGATDFAKTALLTGTPDGTNQVIFTAPTNELIYDVFAFDPDGTGLNTDYISYQALAGGVYAGAPQTTTSPGSTYEISAITGFGTNAITVTYTTVIPPATVSSIDLVVNHSYTPTTSDKINFYYDHEPYQGNNQNINKAIIRSLGKSGVIHNLGTGGDEPSLRSNLLVNVSSRLPMPSDGDDSDLTSTVELTPFGGLPSTYYRFSEQNNDPSRGTGVLPYTGQRIFVQDIRDFITSPSTPLPEEPKRGIDFYFWVMADKNGTISEDNAMEVVTVPLLNELINIQGCWYGLVEHPTTGELLMFVVSSLGKNLGISSQTTTVVDSQSDFQNPTFDGQTDFTVSFDFTPGGQLQVYRNGVLQILGKSYIELGGSIIRFIDPVGGLLTTDDLLFLLPKGSVTINEGSTTIMDSNYSLPDSLGNLHIAYDVYRCIGRPTVKPTKKYGDGFSGGTDYEVPSGGIAQRQNF